MRKKSNHEEKTQIFLNKWKVEWKVRHKPLQTCIQGWILWMKVDNCAEEFISMWNFKCGFTERGSTFLLEMQYLWSLLEMLKSLSILSSRILEAGVICLINSSKENNNKRTLCLLLILCLFVWFKFCPKKNTLIRSTVKDHWTFQTFHATLNYSWNDIICLQNSLFVTFFLIS